ncbi:DUF4116 domain-containing protein [Salmonella enterica subsp. salamae]|nr:DUF4116 domain-containing protein [Salmonella enterica subsp. salamae]ECJ2283212.1 DUF4116 domain-containing protein [Salmonella enterica subsp. salamae]HCC0888556.1 DUF4116 domain-containing protein [Salmonella enterica]
MRIPANKILFTNHTQATSQTPKEQKIYEPVSHSLNINNPRASLNLNIGLSDSPLASLSLPKERRKFTYIKNDSEVNKAVRGITNPTNKCSFFTKNTPVHSLENRASKIITKFMREHISDKSYDYMFTHGISWRMLSEKHQEKGLELIRKISKENISNLCKELRPLDNNEKSFLASMLTIKLRATHASDANLINKNGTFGIYSRKLLIKNKIPFPESHSMDDIYFLSNDDFVFFALETGEENKKASSRFGSMIYSIDINQPVFEQVSCISLYDHYFPEPPDAGKHINGLSQETVEILKKQDTSKYGFIFFGKDIRAGLGLYILKRIRSIPQNDRLKILSMKGEYELNSVINGILRPELKIPKYFFGKEYTQVLLDGNGEFLDPRKTNDKGYMLDKISKNYRALIHCSDKLKNDYDIASLAVSQQGEALKYVSGELKKDRDLVLKAVNVTGKALEFADEKCKHDKKLVLAAIRQSGKALKYASEELKNDRKFLFKAIQASAVAFMFIPDKFKDDKKLVKMAVQKNGNMLIFASDRLKDDKKIVLLAVKNHGRVLQYASERLKNNKHVVSKAIKNDSQAAIHASERVKIILKLNNQ